MMSTVFKFISVGKIGIFGGLGKKFFGFFSEPKQSAIVCSKSSAPTILPSDTNSAKFASGASRDARAGRQFQRIVAVDWQRKCEADAGVDLLIVAPDAVERGVAPSEIEPVQRHPYAGLESVEDVSLDGIDWRLREGVAAEEILVIAEDQHAGGKFKRPWTPRLGNPQLRFFWTPIDNFYWKALAGRSDELIETAIAAA
jgi:hypothetical protein